MLKKAFKEKGVVPTEKIGKNSALFQLFLDELKKRGIRITEEKTAS
jgi:saccharopine dehydrogenase-like NADP-dependent oxidoreductase